MDAIHRRVATLFPPRSAPRSLRVGLEQELLTADAHTGEVAAIGRVRAATRGAWYADQVSFEPGGQVELSLPCAGSPRELIWLVKRTLEALSTDCNRADVTLVAEPVDNRPLTDAGLQLTSPRYVAMRTHFDRIGPAGRRMMCRTASTQVCLDWWPGRVGLEQWRVLNLAAPFLAAAFARATGPGSRLATWLAVDPSRTAYDDRLLVGDPERAYADFARGAVAFLDGGVDEHLTTLFPPVRPRGRYLEVRFPDVQTLEGIGELTSVLNALAFDEACRRAILRRLEPHSPDLAGQWLDAAHDHPDVVACGRELVALAVPAALGGAA